MAPHSKIISAYRLTAGSSLRATARPAAIKSFSTSQARALNDGDKPRNTSDMGHNTRHVLEKADDKEPNQQAYESSQGQKNKAEGTGGNATAQKDSTGQKEKIKQEHPEAPDAIGLQDERGRAK